MNEFILLIMLSLGGGFVGTVITMEVETPYKTERECVSASKAQSEKMIAMLAEIDTQATIIAVRCIKRQVV